MTRKIALALSLALVAAVAVTAAASGKKHHKPTPPVKTANNSKLGTILVNSKGMTLYRLKGETTASLKCTDKVCLAVWPPATAKSLSGEKVTHLSIFTRSDTHQRQVAYKGEPLYTFASDHKAGDATGQNVENFVVITVKKKSSNTQTSSPPTTTSYPGY